MKRRNVSPLNALPNHVHVDAGWWIFCERCGDEDRLPRAVDDVAAWRSAIEAFGAAHRHDGAPASADQLRREGEAFRAMVERSSGDSRFDAWEIVGEARRGKPGRDVVHIVRSPRLETTPSGFRGTLIETSLYWLLGAGEITGRDGSYGRARGPRSFIAEWRGRRHVLHFADPHGGDWGVKLVRHTGPVLYWRMLRARLRMAGTLDVDDAGRACWFDCDGPSGEPELEPIRCPDEQTFFRLARTRWVAPCGRYAPHAGVWPRGILPPWYPPEVPYRSARAEPHLFTRKSPRPPRRPERLLSGPAAAGITNPLMEVRS